MTEEVEEEKDPFSFKGKNTKFGKGVILNDINSVLEYIIDIVESQNNNISKLDLNKFLIKYIIYNKEKITEKIHKKVLEAFIYCLKYFLDYKIKRKDLISQNEDKFNIHSLSKRSLDEQDTIFQSVLNLLSDLISSDNIKFTDEELFKIKLASGKPFNLINIKIAEKSKNYKDCIKLYLEEEKPKLKEKIYKWIEDKFDYFNKELNKENQENILLDIKKDYSKFIDAIIEKSSELVQIKLDRTKIIVDKYLKNDEKLRVYNNLKKFPKEQFEFLELLLYRNSEKIKEIDEENIREENGEEKEKNIDLFELYKSNMNENDNNKNMNKEKIYRKQFDSLLIEQINLLINLKRENEIRKYLEKNIRFYQTFPLREALNKCIENDIIDGALYIYQLLNENKEAFDLTLRILDKSFNKYKESSEKDDKDFLDKLDSCLKICKRNSESLLKKEQKIKNKKELENEGGEQLWFDLLKKLYEYEDSLENNKNKEKIKATLDEGVALLLKEICSYVRIQELIKYVTENQKKAQYKEYKAILEKMLRNNNSFDRVLHNVMIILKNSIENSESTRKKVTSRGNNYNIKKCDVCNQFFDNSKKEIVYFFGCGHQSHERCCYKKKLNNSKNIIIIENEDNFIPGCEVCRKNRIEDENKNEDEYENFILNEDKEASENINVNKDNIKMNAFKFGNKENKFKKLNKYDKKYQNEASIFY